MERSRTSRAIFLQLVENGTVDFHGPTYFGNFFECAAKCGNNEFLSRFLSGSDIDEYQSVYHTPLSSAASVGLSSTVNLMLSSSFNLATKGQAYKDAITRAAENGHKDIIVELMKHSIAAHSNHIQLLVKALERGARINDEIKGPRCQTPVSWAAYRGHNDIVDLLLAKGAKEDCRPYKAFCTAIVYGFASTFMLLLDHYIGEYGRGNYDHVVNNAASDGAWPPLVELAAQHGQGNMVRLIHDLRFDLELFPEIGHIALRKAAENGYLSIARMLIEMGVDVDGEDGGGAPVVKAAEFGREDMVTLLVQLKAKTIHALRFGAVERK